MPLSALGGPHATGVGCGDQMRTRRLRLSISLVGLALAIAAAACGRVDTPEVPDAKPPVEETCEAPRTRCDSGCSDTATDRNNCGGCGVACQTGETCVGHCEPGCTTSADCPSTTPMCEAGRCAVPSDCSDLLVHYPGAPDGVYTVDPDGTGPTPAFAAQCDMTTDGGGWTIVAAYSGGDGETPLTGDTIATGDPFRFAHYNLDRVHKIAISLKSTETLLRTANSWLKVNAPLFDEKLAAPNYRQPPLPVTLTASNGATAPGFMGYVNYEITGGGVFGISVSPDGPTCGAPGVTTLGFDQHSPNYHNLNCGCLRQYLYSHSGTVLDGDAGYDVNTGLGSWAATSDCGGGEGGILKFYAAMRGAPTSCSDIHRRNPAAPSGVYTIDPDDSLGASGFPVYCDMTSDKGGWTLLLSANATSTYFGNNSASWKEPTTTGTTPSSISLATGDYKSVAYAKVPTGAIRLCYRDVNHCHVFNHGKSIPLLKFFTDNLTYTEYATHLTGYADRGGDADRAGYLGELGVGERVPPNVCFWLGINQLENAAAIGLIGDSNGGCTGPDAGKPESFVNDLAIGVGLQSCYDNNGCAPFGSGHHAGHSRGADGVDMSPDLGPWFVFGR
jgi:hypothetical protein